MTTFAFDAMASGSVWTFDYLVNLLGTPVISSAPTLQDGQNVVLNGTAFTGSGNSVFVSQNGVILQLPIITQTVTQLVAGPLSMAGLYLTQPVAVYMTNASAVQSNSVNVNVLPQAGMTAWAITQDFLGDPTSRASGNPDDTNTDEIRAFNMQGSGTYSLTSQGAWVVDPTITAIDYVIFNGTVVGDPATATFADSATVLVPNLLGLDPITAGSVANAAGFQSTLIGSAQSVDWPLGTIAAQFPLAGSTYTPGAVIELTESLGATGVIVPNLIGSTQLVAQGTLGSLGLLFRAFNYIDGLNTGLVITQSVAAGTIRNVGDEVDFSVSSSILPNVVGLQINTAVALLQNANLVVAPLLFANGPAPVGVVTAQSPPANTSVNPSDVITLTISLGPISGIYMGVSGPTVSRVGTAGVSGPTVGGPEVM